MTVIAALLPIVVSFMLLLFNIASVLGCAVVFCLCYFDAYMLSRRRGRLGAVAQFVPTQPSGLSSRKRESMSLLTVAVLFWCFLGVASLHDLHGCMLASD